MTDQLALFTTPGVRHDDPATSVTAAKKVAPSHQSRLIRIAAIVDAAGYWGATADDIYLKVRESTPDATRSTWHRAVSSALDEGLIIERGDKHVRLSMNNSPMRVYITPNHQR